MEQGTGPDNESEKTLLQQCPACSYALRGLPVRHRCPECGVAFDRRWKVFGGRTMSPNRYRRRRIITVLVVGWVLVVFGVLLSRRTLLPIVPVIFLFFAVQGGYAIWSVCSRPRGFVAMGPDGLFIFKGLNHTDYFEWTEVEEMKCDWFSKTVTLRAGKVNTHLSMQDFFGSDGAEVERCVHAVNRAVGKSPL